MLKNKPKKKIMQNLSNYRIRTLIYNENGFPGTNKSVEIKQKEIHIDYNRLFLKNNIHQNVSNNKCENNNQFLE